MLMLQLQVGADRYGLDIEKVIEVSSLVSMRAIPHAPPEVSGIFNYRGTLTPVLDLTFLLSGVASHPLMSTRIILVSHEDRDGCSRILGLLAERVTEFIRCEKEDMQQPVVSVNDAPYLGDIIFDERGSIQVLKINRLLNRNLLSILFPMKAGEL